MKELLQRDDIYKESFSFTQEQVELFAKLSMDMNPIHLDADFASKTIFKKPIIHGYLGSSIFSRVLGTAFPGNGTIYISQTLSFKKPMFVNTIYCAEFRVLEVINQKHQAVIETLIKDSDQSLIVTGEARILNLEKI